MNTQRKWFYYDESYRRMDEWMARRRDVVLAGDLRTGGSPDSRRAY
jgi:hypothetical protein